MDFMFQLRRIDWGHVYCESKLIKRSEKKRCKRQELYELM